MLRKLTYGFVLCSVFAMGATTAQAVDLTLELNATEFHPGDWVEVTVTVENDTAKKDIVHVTFSATAVGYPVTGVARMRMKMAPGEVVVETIAMQVPTDLPPLPGPVEVTLTGVATGKKSKTNDTESVTGTLIP